jgi:hypothetical protein
LNQYRAAVEEGAPEIERRPSGALGRLDVEDRVER